MCFNALQSALLSILLCVVVCSNAYCVSRAALRSDILKFQYVVVRVAACAAVCCSALQRVKEGVAV